MSDWEIVPEGTQSDWELFNPDALQQSQAAQQMQQPDEESLLSSIGSNFMAGVHGANRGFSKIFGFGPHVQAMQEEYEKAKETNPFSAELGNVGAQVFSSIPFMMTGTAAAEALPFVAEGGAAANILGSALGGGAQGFAETPTGDETRLGNTVFGAVLGGAAGGAGQLLGNIPKKLHQIFPENVAKAIDKQFTKVSSKAHDLYQKVFTNPKAASISTWTPNGKQMQDLTNYGGKYVENTLKQYQSMPTPSNLKLLESSIGKAQAEISRGTVGNVEKNATRKILENVSKDIDLELQRLLPGDLYGNLRAADKYFADNKPMFDFIEDSLKLFNKGQYPANEVVKEAYANPSFRQVFGKEIPGIKYAFSDKALTNLPGILGDIPLVGDIGLYALKKLAGL